MHSLELSRKGMSLPIMERLPTPNVGEVVKQPEPHTLRRGV